MLERFKLVRKLEEKIGIHKRVLRHLAITTHGMDKWAEKHRKPILEVYKNSFKMINELVELQISYNIPILTIYLLPSSMKKGDNFLTFLKIVFLLICFNKIGHQKTGKTLLGILKPSIAIKDSDF